jgi:hypothetical protein
MPDVDRPPTWRMRAEQLRTLMDQASDPVIRLQLAELADTWDTMAERLERRFSAEVIRLRS